MNSFEQYGRRGYSYLHNLAANQLLMYLTGAKTANIAQMTIPVPGTVGVDDDFMQTLEILLPFLLLVSFIPPVYNMVFRLVKEKESGAKESMRMMGMTDASYWLSWFVYFSLINTVITLLIWGTLMINVINYSNPLYPLMFFWLYGEAIFGQIVFLQSFFSVSKYAGIVATVVYFGSAMLNYFIGLNSVSFAGKIFASLVPQAALQQGAITFVQYECTGAGMNSQTASQLYNNYSFRTALIMMSVSAITFMLLGMWLDAVLPSKYGKRRSVCYCLSPSFYGCCRQNRRRNGNGEEENQYLVAS